MIAGLKHIPHLNFLQRKHSPDVCGENDTDKLKEHLTKNKGAILIIIDGLDEMPSWNELVLQTKFQNAEIGIDDQKGIPELINGLITGTVLQGVNVLATTRPQECLARLKNHAKHSNIRF